MILGIVTGVLAAVALIAFGIYVVYKKSRASIVETYNIVEYRSVGDCFKNAINDNLSLSGRDVALLDNPDRGFRGEVYFRISTDEAYPDSGLNAMEELEKEAVMYADDNVKIVQMYVYLYDFAKRELTKEAIDQITACLRAVRDKGFRVLLRFTYEYDSTKRVGPTTRMIVRHTEQLKEWFRDNIELVNSAVYCMQLGMIGL